MISIHRPVMGHLRPPLPSNNRLRSTSRPLAFLPSTDVVSFSGSDTPKPQLLDWKAYCELTGFPNGELMREKVETFVTQAINNAANEAGVKVLFAVYDPLCSLATGNMLPGESDIDHLTVLLKKASDEQQEQFVNVMESQFEQGRSMTQLGPFGALTLKQLTECSRETYREKYWDPLWNPMPKAEYQKYLADVMIGEMTEGKVLINKLEESTQALFLNSVMYTGNLFRPYINKIKSAGMKTKYLPRQRLINAFKDLTSEEKKWVVHHLQTDKPVVPHNGRLDKPTKKLYDSLVKKGVLVKLKAETKFRVILSDFMRAFMQHSYYHAEDYLHMAYYDNFYVAPWKMTGSESYAYRFYQDYEPKGGW